METVTAMLQRASLTRQRTFATFVYSNGAPYYFCIVAIWKRARHVTKVFWKKRKTNTNAWLPLGTQTKLMSRSSKNRNSLSSAYTVAEITKKKMLYITSSIDWHQELINFTLTLNIISNDSSSSIVGFASHYFRISYTCTYYVFSLAGRVHCIC